MLTYENKNYYTKDEVIKILNNQKSENKSYLKHIYNIIISRIHNSKQKFYKFSENTDIFKQLHQNLIMEYEKQYIEVFNVVDL